MADNMVERVGLEILDELESRKGFRQVIDEIENDGADLYDEVRDAVGRAAIAAMREPTEEMCKCAESNWSGFCTDGGAFRAARRLYRAMIAAAED